MATRGNGPGADATRRRRHYLLKHRFLDTVALCRFVLASVVPHSTELIGPASEIPMALIGNCGRLLYAWAALCWMLLLIAEPLAAQGRRVALVIGNSTYQHIPTLKNPGNDARDISAALRELGFEVIEGLNLNYESMRRAILEFSQRLEGSDVGLLFYAGHGIQYSDQNYLVPTDAKLKHIRDIDLQLMDLSRVLDQMERETSTRIIILDACRDNPFLGSISSPQATPLKLSRGLSQIGGGAGSFIAFATKPGDVAIDGGEASNSPFTGALKSHIRKAGVSINEIMIEVRRDVMATTGQRQIPWEHSSLTNPFFFSSAAPAQLPAANLKQELVERTWEEVRAADRIGIYRAFIDAFPDSLHSRLALGRILELGKREAPTRTQRVNQTTGRTGTAPQLPEQRDFATRLPAVAQSRSTLPVADSQKGANEKTPFRDCDECPLVVSIDPGNFVMGSNTSEQGRQVNEGPPREVRITRGFGISVYEVSVAEYSACVKDGACVQPQASAQASLGPLGDMLNARRPVTNVTWNDAQNYTNWLSQKTGWRYKLPSEAEWEYVARAGASTPFSWGDVASFEHVNCIGCIGSDKRRYTNIVGQMPANDFGVHDMHGNVWEWVADCWHKNYARAPNSHWAWLDRDLGDCSRRVLRGGSWSNSPNELRSAYRLSGKTSARGELIGFRVTRVNEILERISYFVEQTYLSTFAQNGAEVRGLYCDNVDYYGKLSVPIQRVLEDKVRYFKRWPHRRFSVYPGSFRLSEPKIGSDLYTVYFRYNYRVSTSPFNSEDLSLGDKGGETTLSIRITDREIKVCAEDGRTIR